MTLEEFFAANPRAALGLSGGADSAYLLCAALRCGADVRPYYVKTQFQPEFELRDALRLTRELGVGLTVLELDILSSPCVAANTAERCYHCKSALFSALAARAAADGFKLLIDGTNASDSFDDRPGMRALRELNVRSPLRECGITKTELRRLSASAGLFTASKPAYACLATRIPVNELITAGKLRVVESAEDAVRALGFTDFRVRLRDGAALLQFCADELPRALAEPEIFDGAIGSLFTGVSIDSEPR